MLKPHFCSGCGESLDSPDWVKHFDKCHAVVDFEQAAQHALCDVRTPLDGCEPGPEPGEPQTGAQTP